MIQLMDFAEPTQENDRVVQMALREIDTGILAAAAVVMDETEREVVYRNMSKRAGALMREEVAQAAKTTSETRGRQAKEFFVQKLRKYREYFQRRPEEAAAGRPPALQTSNEEEIVESFVELVRYARQHGNLALERVEIKSEFSIAKKGIELVVDGWEPMLSRSLLEQAKKAYLANVERRLDMVIEGFDSLLSSDLPIVTEERLRSHLAQ